jgi:hypothetical protein
MSRVAKVRERVLAIRAKHPDWPAYRVAKSLSIPASMARRILGEPLPPRQVLREKPQQPERFNWKQQGRGCDRLLQRINQFHPDAQAA